MTCDNSEKKNCCIYSNFTKLENHPISKEPSPILVKSLIYCFSSTCPDDCVSDEIPENNIGAWFDKDFVDSCEDCIQGIRCDKNLAILFNTNTCSIEEHIVADEESIDEFLSESVYLVEYRSCVQFLLSESNPSEKNQIELTEKNKHDSCLGFCCWVTENGSGKQESHCEKMSSEKCTLLKVPNANLDGKTIVLSVNFNDEADNCTEANCSQYLPNPSGTCCYYDAEDSSWKCVESTKNICHTTYNGIFDSEIVSCENRSCVDTKIKPNSGSCCYFTKQNDGSYVSQCKISTQSECALIPNSVFNSENISCSDTACYDVYAPNNNCGACCLNNECLYICDQNDISNRYENYIGSLNISEDQRILMRYLYDNQSIYKISARDMCRVIGGIFRGYSTTCSDYRCVAEKVYIDR